MNYVFIITIIILIFSTLQGWRKGMFGIIYRLISWIFMFIFMAIAQPHIHEFLLNNTPIYQDIYEQSLEAIEKKAQTTSEEMTVSDWINTMTQGVPVGNDLRFLLSYQDEDTSIKDTSEQEFHFSIDPSIVSNMGERVDTVGGYNSLLQMSDGEHTLQEALAISITDFVINGISLMIGFVVAQLVIWIVGMIINAVGRLPVIRQVNRLLGIAAGAIEGLLIVYVFMFIIACMNGTSLGQLAIANVYANAFLTSLYENNLIIAIMNMII